MNLPDAILARTAGHLNARPEALCSAVIEKGGSDRFFHRITDTASGRSLILIRYGNERAENSHYVQIANFLDAAGVHVPHVFEHDEAGQWIWMQDLGEHDLWHFRNAPWQERRTLYFETLRQVHAIHKTATARWRDTALPLQPVFDASLYTWEQDYFVAHCLGDFFQKRDTLPSIEPLRNIANHLAALPRSLVHRDFQSQNIMVVGPEIYFIDFQGLRPGLPHYDLASLLYDPYVNLPAPEREELLTHAKSHYFHDDPDFDRTFVLCAMQRLMQALGAYGNLGINKGRRHFLEHIPRALPLLCGVLGQIPELDAWHDFLKQLPPC